MRNFPVLGRNFRPRRTAVCARDTIGNQSTMLIRSLPAGHNSHVSFPTFPFAFNVGSGTNPLNLSSARQSAESRKSAEPLFSTGFSQSAPPFILPTYCRMDKLRQDCGLSGRYFSPRTFWQIRKSIIIKPPPSKKWGSCVNLGGNRLFCHGVRNNVRFRPIC